MGLNTGRERMGGVKYRKASISKYVLFST